ncbi:TetR family transcriptional regulator [Actinocatenispora thailandica]|uniref:TetR family transcriptional regulator n=1 Tax=Actinocatenispora thailandica TaxID=227318 RepID=A0A7R7DRI3_9ACTN|nr:TetR/AcrR family transcriptional regulator [Actinocatenispora thailandica]BCJ36570.1 TetR family transcriptional regulator [Actinocatenispora thailandica]
MATAGRGRPRSFDRDAALDQAVRLFWRRGYEATSIRDLTSELGIGAPSLYHAFGDKQQLFAEALRRYDTRYGQFIDRALAEEPTARDAAARVLHEGPQRYTRRGLPTGCLIASGDANTDNAEVRDLLRQLRNAKVAGCAAKIRADVAAGRLPADTDATALGRYLMTTLSGIAQAARDGVGRPQLERVAALALRAWPTAS